MTLLFGSRWVAVALVCIGGVALRAQEKNVVGAQIGVALTPGLSVSPSEAAAEQLSFQPSLALGVDYDRRLGGASIGTKHLAFYGGLDFLASPFDVKLSNPSQNVSPQYAYVFLTPHVKVELHPEGRLSPWVSAGGGYTRFREAAPPNARTFQQGSNTGAAEFGAGVDTKSILRLHHVPIGFRLEARDFLSGLPQYGQPSARSLQNTVVLSGGLLLKF